MKVTRLDCPGCGETDVLFSGMTHVKCGYVLPLIPLKAINFHGATRTIAPAVRLSVRKGFLAGATRISLARKHGISVKSVREMVRDLAAERV